MFTCSLINSQIEHTGVIFDLIEAGKCSLNPAINSNGNLR